MTTQQLTDDLIGATGEMTVTVDARKQDIAMRPERTHHGLKDMLLGREWKTSKGQRLRCVGLETVVTETGLDPIVKIRQHVVTL